MKYNNGPFFASVFADQINDGKEHYNNYTPKIQKILQSEYGLKQCLEWSRK